MTQIETPADDTIAVTIPAYQAEFSIGDVVRRTLDVLPAVLVVDDGSDDGTAEEAELAGAEVVSHPENRGKGAALRTAFGILFERGAAAVVTLDADGQHLAEEIPKLIVGYREGADLVLGTRDHLYSDMSRLRRISNRLSSRAISRAAGLDLRDIQTGFRLYSKRLIDATGFPESRFDAESAVIVRAGRRGLKVVTVPVRLGVADGRGTSHYAPGSTASALPGR